MSVNFNFAIFVQPAEPFARQSHLPVPPPDPKTVDGGSEDPRAAKATHRKTYKRKHGATEPSAAGAHIQPRVRAQRVAPKSLSLPRASHDRTSLASDQEDADDSSFEEETAPSAPRVDDAEEDDDEEEAVPFRAATLNKALDLTDLGEPESHEPRGRGDTDPSAPKPPKSLYREGNRLHFNPEARNWFKAFWKWLLRKCRAEGRSLPSVYGASKMMHEAATSAGVFMANRKAFLVHRSGQLAEYKRIETEIVGRPYQRGWHKWKPMTEPSS
ncbi:hypothetical protein AURDEDRAFT_181947 [Auricularia subglabra TFB-10046 SS5]|nr:hypothetical protein AURDEDRAFT_181947 [Auricularia subglabra TFB-10046 SS5]